MNKTKRELFDENKRLKERQKLLNEWLYSDSDNLSIDKLVQQTKLLNRLTKIMLFIIITLLLFSTFLLGVTWN